MIIVIGEILIDIFPDYQRIGGAPFNFAFHLKKLGFPVRLISRVGDDRHGREIMAMLKENGFNAADIQLDSRLPTGTVRVALDKSGVPQFDICQHAAYDHLDLSRDAVTDDADAAMTYFGSLLQRTDAGRRQVQRFFARQVGRGVRFCDINMRPPHINRRTVDESLHQADLLKLNDDELAKIQHEFGGPSNAEALIRWLMEEFSIKAVALTRGSQGCTFTSRETTISCPAHKDGAIVDTVGAGDGFASILVAGYIRRIPWEETIRQASRFAGRICSIPGAVPEDETFYGDLRPFMAVN